jgi:hypothetical protein
MFGRSQPVSSSVPGLTDIVPFRHSDWWYIRVPQSGQNAPSFARPVDDVERWKRGSPFVIEKAAFATTIAIPKALPDWA